MLRLSVQPFLPSAITISYQPSISVAMRTFVPSCRTNRSVAERSGRTLDRDCRRHHHRLFAAQHVAPFGYGERRRYDEYRQCRECAVESRLADGDASRQQEQQRECQYGGECGERNDAPCRATHRVADAAHPAVEEEFGYDRYLVLGLRLGYREIVAHVVVRRSEFQRLIII